MQCEKYKLYFFKVLSVVSDAWGGEGLSIIVYNNNEPQWLIPIRITRSVDMSRSLFFPFERLLYMYVYTPKGSAIYILFLSTLRFNSIPNKVSFSSDVSKKCKRTCLGL